MSRFLWFTVQLQNTVSKMFPILSMSILIYQIRNINLTNFQCTVIRILLMQSTTFTKGQHMTAALVKVGETDWYSRRMRQMACSLCFNQLLQIPISLQKMQFRASYYVLYLEFLWPPCVADADIIFFTMCFLLSIFLSFLA